MDYCTLILLVSLPVHCTEYVGLDHGFGLVGGVDPRPAEESSIAPLVIFVSRRLPRIVDVPLRDTHGRDRRSSTNSTVQQRASSH